MIFRKTQNNKQKNVKEVTKTPDSEDAKATNSSYQGPFFFGHKKSGKTFKSPKGKKGKPIEMHELMESLPS